MKKSLLLGLLAMGSALTASAGVNEGDFVTTAKVGKYKVVSPENLIGTNFVDGFAGWTALSATADRAAGDQFQYAAIDSVTGAPAGIVAIYSEPTEGMSYKLNTLDPNTTYVLTMSVTAPETANGTTNFNTRLGATFDSQTYANSVQIVNIIGTDAEGGVVDFGFPTEILPGTHTYTWAINCEGTAREFEIKLLGWNTGLRIHDVEIHEAQQVGDPRSLQPTIDYAKAVLGMTENWGEDPGGYIEALNDCIKEAEAIIAQSEASQDEYDTAAGNISDVLDEMIAEGMADDFLPDALDKLPKAASKVSRAGNIGHWKDDANRIHSAAGDYYDLGHFQYSNGWGNAGSGGRIGLVYYGIELVPGDYIFSVDLKGNAREFVKNAWSINEGLEFADAILTVQDANDAENKVDVVTTGRYPLSPFSFTKNWLVFRVEQAGVYDIRIDTYAKEAYDGIKSGSVVFPFGAALYAKTTATYTKAETDYEADVRGQIEAGRNAITEANTLLADETKSWGKPELTEAVAVAEPLIAAYEAWTEAEIIATFNKDIYDASKGLSEVDQDSLYYRMMAAEVYQTATKDILAAVNAFKAKNDTIDMLTSAIANAEVVRAMRIYTLSTVAATLDAKIAEAKTTETALRADAYSVENAATVIETIAALNEVVEQFKNGLPAEAIATVVDMDGTLAAKLGEVSYEVSKVGGAGKMVIENFNAETPNGHTSYGLGYIVNEENLFPNLLRVGSGEGVVDFAAGNPENIVKISFDMYFGNLTTKYAGFYIKEAVETTDSTGTKTEYNDIAGLYISKYDGKDQINTFGVDYNGKINAVGSSSAANDAIAAESNKTHFDIVMDLATKKMSMSSYNSAKGSFQSEELAFTGVPARFVLMSDYNNADRRSFFGGLKIESISAGEFTGVSNVAGTVAAKTVKMLQNGQVVIIKNGQKFNVAGQMVK